MGLFKAIFGGTDRSAQRQQIQDNAANRNLFQSLATQSGDQAKSLYGAADTNRNLSLQQILGMLGGSIPEQISVQQQGNMGAQQQLIGGLPMIQAALMGQPINMAALQPTRINANTSWAQQRLPQFTTSQQALDRGQPPPPDLSSLLGGSAYDV